MKVAFLDNFDSFTYNLVHYLNNAGADVELYHNTELKNNLSNIFLCDSILIGPGPNSPNESGELMEILPQLIELNKPILGICLGLQAIGEHFGMNLTHALLPVHGKSFLANHINTPLFDGIENPMVVGRYHSLIVQETDDSKNTIRITAMTNESEIMALEHTTLPIEAVQFHPESVLTPQGQILITNWIQKAIK